MKFWKELEDLSEKEDLKEMRKYYHLSYLNTCWNAFFSFYATFLFINFVILFINLDFSKEIPTVTVIPLIAIVILAIIDCLIQLKNELIEYVFMIILSIEAIFITQEGLLYDKYKFHEPWLIFYSTFIIISVSCCFHWKRMLVLYFVIQTFNFVQLHLTYGKLDVYFYSPYAFISILLPLVCMILARIILVFLLSIHNNVQLVKTIKRILQVFPEGFLIQSLEEKSANLLLQFVNNTAIKNIIRYDDPLGKPILDEKLNYKINLIDNTSKITTNIDDEEKINIQSLSELLRSHVESIEKYGAEATSSIQLRESSQNTDSESLICKHYNLKSVKVKWGTNKNSFIHVFVNTTAFKQFEVEKARNECLQLMFSSISHEFRTPLNAFTNSVLLLESNYNIIKSNIDQLGQDLRDSVIPPKIRDTNDKFYKICKISTSSLMSLVDDILDLAKIESGKFSLNEQPFIINNLIEDIEFIFGFQCVQKGISFKVVIDSSLKNSQFCSDLGRIKQILMNLISNSFKFTQNGGIVLKISQKQDFDPISFERNYCLQFKVTDTGVGIPENDIPNLFQMFGIAVKYRNKLNCRGTGLGLTISKKLVESLGGSISLKSKEGTGTSIKFTICEKHEELGLLEHRELDHNENISSERGCNSERLAEVDESSRKSIPVFHTQLLTSKFENL